MMGKHKNRNRFKAPRHAAISRRVAELGYESTETTPTNFKTVIENVESKVSLFGSFHRSLLGVSRVTRINNHSTCSRFFTSALFKYLAILLVEAQLESFADRFSSASIHFSRVHAKYV